MTATIRTERCQMGGFTFYRWHLQTEWGEFFLGQAEKVCQRLLGLSPTDVARELADWSGQAALPVVMTDAVRERLALMVLDALQVPYDDELALVDPWSFAVE